MPKEITPLNIALIISNLSFGGGESGVLRMHKALNSMQDAQSHLFVIGEKKDYSTKDIPNITFINPKTLIKFRNFKEFVLSKRLKANINKHPKFDLIISNLNSANRITKKAKLENSFFYIRNNLELESKATKKPKRHRKLFHEILNNENCFCVSSELSETLKKGDYISPKSITVLRNVLNIEEIKHKSELKNNSSAITSPYILHIGRFTPQKRHDVLINAYSKSSTNIPLICITDKVGALKNEITKISLNQKKINVLPFQDNPYEWIKNAELVVISSDHEGVSNIMLESLALNTKIISTKCEFGATEVMSEHLSHYLVDKENDDLLAKKIDWAIDNPFIKMDTSKLKVFEEMTPQFIKSTINNTAKSI